MACNAIPETSRGLFVGYGCAEAGPYVLLDHLEAVPWRRERIWIRDRTFTLDALTQRHCTGRHDLATGHSLPCPSRSELPFPGVEQCNACFAATGFNPAFYNAQQVSPQQRRRNREPHVVYLVSFGLGLLKVGITHAPRHRSRMLEQGARLGAVIARFPDADRARELEADVARSTDIAEAVRSARKRHLLGAPFALAAARTELRTRLLELAESRAELDGNAQILHLDSDYGGADLFEGQITDLSETEPLAISGHCLGMVGDILVMLQAGQRYMLSVGPLLAQNVRLCPGERQNRFVGQLGLPF